MAAGRVSAEPCSIGAALWGTLAALGLEERLRCEAVLWRWRELVGHDVARHAMPLRVQDGVLWVGVQNSVWAAQLAYLRSDLLRLLEEGTGARLRDIRFLLGMPAPDRPAGRAVAAPLADACPEDERLASEWASCIADGRLRELWRRVVVAGRRRARRWGCSRCSCT